MFKKIIEKCKNLLILGRYHSPIGAFLLMWPCYWGTLSGGNLNTNLLKTLLYFTIGAIVMRGAGCCINDIFDRNYDGKIQRTKNRPLVSKKITIFEAIIFVIVQLFIGLAVVIQFDTDVILMSFVIIPLVFVYPLFKRFTHFPQVILGLVFNWGVLIGHMSQTDFFNYTVLYLYFAGVLLTIAYDTVYGFQDLEGDKKLGLKSLAIIFEKKKNFLSLVYISSFLLFSIFFFYNYTNLKINIFFCLIILYFLAKQFLAFKNNSKFMVIFKSNSFLGGVISILIAIQSYF